MTTPAIAIEGVWKRFDRAGSRSPTLKESVLRIGRRAPRDWFWALQEIDLRVDPGETVGVIGANGSGKSTLLRLVAGIGRPTRGRVVRNRNVDAMLSLGESFDMLLTGRENAITAAILSGYTQRQAVAKLDEIVAFAELEESFHQPLRTYSDGMRLRLAFSVAISVDPEVLLIDEVLSVGDHRFQDKCIARLEALQQQGAAILFASHDEQHIRRLCNRAVWLTRGRIQARGVPDEVYAAYHEAIRIETERRAGETPLVPRNDVPNVPAEERYGTLEAEIARVVVSPSIASSEDVGSDSPITLTIDIDPRSAIDSPIIGVTLLRVGDGATMLNINSDSDGLQLGRIDRPTRVELVLDRLDIEPGAYCFDVGLYERSWAYIYDYHWQAYPFELRARELGGFGPPRRWSTIGSYQ